MPLRADGQRVHSDPLYGTMILGIPLTTFTATCIAGILYLVVVIALFAMDCPFNRNVSMYLVFHLVALVAIATMAGINMMYTRYRFNCLSLSVSLLYSGSAALVLFGLVWSSLEGLCEPAGAEAATGLWSSGHAGNYIVWFTSATALAFQIIAHYYYG